MLHGGRATAHVWTVAAAGVTALRDRSNPSLVVGWGGSSAAPRDLHAVAGGFTDVFDRYDEAATPTDSATRTRQRPEGKTLSLEPKGV